MSLKTVLYLSVGFFLAALFGLPLDELAKPLTFAAVLAFGFCHFLGWQDTAQVCLKYGVFTGILATVWAAIVASARRAAGDGIARVQASLPHTGILGRLEILDWILILIFGLVVLWLVGKFVLARATAQLDGAFKHESGPVKLRPRYRADPPPTYEAPRFPVPADRPVALFEDRQ